MSAVSFEVTAEVRADLRDTFRQYLIEEHIPDLMNTNAFAEATISVSEDAHLRIRYEAKNRDLLNAYFEDHAPRLRQSLSERFPDGIKLSRVIWEEIGRFSPDIEPV